MNPQVPREYCVYFVYGRADYPVPAGGLAAGESMAAGGNMNVGGGTDSPPAIVEINLVDEGAAGSSTDPAPGASSASSTGPNAGQETEVASPDSAATSLNENAPWRRRQTGKKPPPAT